MYKLLVGAFDGVERLVTTIDKGWRRGRRSFADGPLQNFLFGLILLVTGLILLVAMVGAIVLTHRQRPDGARGHQNITKQVRRNPDEATVMKQPEVGKGIEL